MSDIQTPPHPTWAYITPSQWNAVFEPFIARIAELEGEKEGFLLDLERISDERETLGAELGALRTMLTHTCGNCYKWTTNLCAVAWKDGEDSWVGAGDHDDYCSYWRPREG